MELVTKMPVFDLYKNQPEEYLYQGKIFYHKNIPMIKLVNTNLKQKIYPLSELSKAYVILTDDNTVIEVQLIPIQCKVLSVNYIARVFNI